MNTKARPVVPAYRSPTPFSADKIQTETPCQGDDVLAELMFELAVRDMSRRTDVRRPRPRAS